MNRYRDKTQIYKAILTCLPQPKTRIMYIATLGHRQLNDHLDDMLQLGLIKPLSQTPRNSWVYGITYKGQDYLEKINYLISLQQ